MWSCYRPLAQSKIPQRSTLSLGECSLHFGHPFWASLFLRPVLPLPSPPPTHTRTHALSHCGRVKTPYGNGILLEIRVSAGRADDPDDELNDKNEAGAEAEAEAAGGGGGGTVAGEGEAMVDGGAGRAELERESYEVGRWRYQS